MTFGETEATEEEYKKKSKRKNEDEDSEMSIVVVFFWCNRRSPEQRSFEFVNQHCDSGTTGSDDNLSPKFPGWACARKSHQSGQAGTNSAHFGDTGQKDGKNIAFGENIFSD